MTQMALLLCSISASFILLLWTTIVSSYTFCSWRPAAINTDPNAQLSFQCTDPSTPIIIIENAIIGWAYNTMNGNCTNFIGCSQQVPDVALTCTGYNSPCSLNQLAFFTPYASQTCIGPTAYLNYVSVNYSCIAANVQPPSDICNSQQFLYSTGLTYLSTSSSFPLSYTFPSPTIKCSCSFKPLDQTVTANISIRALVVELWDYTSCSQKLMIRSSPNNDTVFCSRTESSNVTTNVQLESNPSISFQSKSTDGHFLLEIRTLTSLIFGTIGSLTCNNNSVVLFGSTSSTNNPSTSKSVMTTAGKTNRLTTNVNPRIPVSTSFSDPFLITTNVAVETTEHLPADVEKQGSNSKTISGGAIGGIVGGIVVLVTFLILIFVCLKRKSKKPSKYTDSSDESRTQMSGRRIPYLEPVDVKKSSLDFETNPSTYEALNLKSLGPCESNTQPSVKYQTLQRPYDTRLLDVEMSDQQKASHTEPVNKVGSSPVYENELAQNYQALHFDEKKARQNEPCDKDYQILHHLHDTNHAHVTSKFQRATLYDTSSSGRSSNKIGLDNPLYQNLQTCDRGHI